MQKKISSKTLYKGGIFTLTQDQVKIENDMIVTRDVIHHHGGVGVLVIKDHAILLVRQYRYPTQRSLLEIPAGKLEKDENPYVCGLRELEEETGYRCQELRSITSFYSTPGFCSEKIYLYEAVAPYKAEHPRSMDEDECISIEWHALKDAYHMVMEGQIQDAKTMIAIQYAMLKTSNT